MSGWFRVFEGLKRSCRLREVLPIDAKAQLHVPLYTTWARCIDEALPLNQCVINLMITRLMKTLLTKLSSFPDIFPVCPVF